MDELRKRPIQKVTYIWLWEKDSTWIPYDKKNSMLIEDAYRNNHGEVTISVLTSSKGLVNYVINLVAMHQYFESDRFQRRPIKRLGPSLIVPRDQVVYGFQDKLMVINCSNSTYPKHWKQFKEFSCDEVDKDSEIFRDMSKMMNDTIGKGGHGHKFGLVPEENRDPKCFEVVRVFQIQSEKLWKNYTCYKSKLQSIKGISFKDTEVAKHLQKKPLLTQVLDHSVNEVLLFHGTSTDIIDAIKVSGFSDRLGSPNSMFGRGIYFAENSSKSNQYISCTKCGHGSIPKQLPCKCLKSEITKPYAMLVSRVILGEAFICPTTGWWTKNSKKDKEERSTFLELKKPDGGVYDSLFAETGENGLNYREFVIYKEEATYPEFIIEFKRG